MSRIAYDHGLCFYITSHDASSADDRPSADPTMRQYRRAGTDERAILYGHFTGKDSSWADVGSIGDNALVVDRSASVDDDGAAKSRLSPNQSAGENLATPSKRRVAGDPRARMYDRSGCQTLAVEPIAKLQTRAAVLAADGDDVGNRRLRHSSTRRQPIAERRLAAINRNSMNRGRQSATVEHCDNLEFRSDERFGDNFCLPCTSPNDEFRHLLAPVTRTGHLSTPPERYRSRTGVP